MVDPTPSNYMPARPEEKDDSSGLKDTHAELDEIDAALADSRERHRRVMQDL